MQTPTDPNATLPPAGPAEAVEGGPPGYEILGEVGRGGMGVVYRARQVALDRVVALKMILGEAGDDELARFRREAEAVARLQHPGIVQIFEVGEYEGRPYLALEFCDGGSLDRRLGGVPLPPPEAARLVQQLAAAVEAAHRANVLHRDLKPANVLLKNPLTTKDTKEGEALHPKVTDFGIARKLDEVGLTQTGAILGTPSYMAPEQAKGSKDLGPACDVYALGAVLYECLTGRPPFRAATTYDTLLQVVNTEPVPPRRLNPIVPRDLETIALKCLSKEVGRRYPSAQALADELGRHLRDEPIKARPVGSLERSRKWLRRNPVLGGTLALLAASIILGFAFTLWALREAGHELYFNQVSLADRDIAAFNYREALKRLKACQPRHRDWEWAYLHRLCCEAPNIGLRHPAGEDVTGYYHGQFSPDGKQFAALAVRKDGKGELAVWDVASRRHVRTIEVPLGDALINDGYYEPQFNRRLVWSPDGRLVYLGSSNQIRGWDPATGQSRRDFPALPGFVTHVAVSPDGQYVAAATYGVFKVWEAATGRECFSRADKGLHVRGAAFRPDTNRLLYFAGDDLRGWQPGQDGDVLLQPKTNMLGFTVAFTPDARSTYFGQDMTGMMGLHRIDLEDGQVRQLIRAQGVLVGSFSRDGSRLALALDEAAGSIKLMVWQREPDELVRMVPCESAGFTSFTLSPDGRRLATTAAASQSGVPPAVALWELVVPAVAAQTHRGAVNQVAVSPDGRLAASAGDDRTVRVWDLETGEAGTTFRGHRGPVTAVAFHPDGRHVASGSDDGIIYVWDPQARKNVTTFHEHVKQIQSDPEKPGQWRRLRSLTFAPDGRSVVSAGGEGQQASVMRWDPFTGAVASSRKEYVDALAWSGDGRLQATAGLKGREMMTQGQLIVRDAAGGEVSQYLTDEHFGVFGGMRSCTSVAFAPGGKRLAFGDNEGHVHLWDCRRGKELLRFRAHPGSVRALAFTADGNRLASGGDERDVRLWDPLTGREVLRLTGHPNGVTSLTFTPTGDRLLSAGRDGVVRLWDTRPAKEPTIGGMEAFGQIMNLMLGNKPAE